MAIFTASYYYFDHQIVMKVGENAQAEIFDSLIVWEAVIVTILQTNKVMTRFSTGQQDEYDNANRCYICCHEFLEGEAKGFKVRDHDHITGWFIGVAYCQCNLELPVSFKIPVFFHNFSGYNAHLTVNEFEKQLNREINVIDQNMEKYLQVEWRHSMVFVTSFNFYSFL